MPDIIGVGRDVGRKWQSFGIIGRPERERTTKDEGAMSATLVLRPDGAIEDATPGALALLNVSLVELRSPPSGAFSPEPPGEEASAAFRAQWEYAGRPDVGGATLQRLDG